MSGCNSSLRQDFIALERQPPESLLSVAASVTKVFKGYLLGFSLRTNRQPWEQQRAINHASL